VDPSTQLMYLCAIVALVALQGVFSAAEIGFLATSVARARHLRDEGHPAGRRLSWMKAHPTRVLTTILICVTGLLYTAETLATRFCEATFSATLHEFAPWVATIAMTVLVLVFAEVTPILYAAQKPEQVAQRTSGLVSTVLWLLYYPVVLPLTLASEGLMRLAGRPVQTNRPTVTEDYLRSVITTGAEQGELDEPDARMLKRVFELGDRTVSQVMVPRPDMVCVAAEETLQTALERAVESRHTRLPIYEGSLDKIVGVLYTKDLLPHLRAQAMHRECRHVAREALFVPENKRLDDLLRELQNRQRMMAIVVDEFGGTAGLVTVEDLLEEIVGEILDETDVEEPSIVELEPGVFLCNATVSLHDLGRQLARSLPEEEFDTLGGFVYDLVGRVPEVGETLAYEDLTLTVREVQGRRIRKVEIARQVPEEQDEQA